MSICEPVTVEEQILRLCRQIEELTQLMVAAREPSLKFCLTVEELAERWALSSEAIRRLVRTKKLKPLRGFRPFRFTMDEIRRYESLESEIDKSALLRGGRR